MPQPVDRSGASHDQLVPGAEQNLNLLSISIVVRHGLSLFRYAQDCKCGQAYIAWI